MKGGVIVATHSENRTRTGIILCRKEGRMVARLCFA